MLHGPVYRKRIEVLTAHILPLLRTGDRVLDVGCGSGALGMALIEQAGEDKELHLAGLETFTRGDEGFPVTRYEGEEFPFSDDSHDVVIVADVLHHEEDPERLVRECMRVSRRLVIIKDHKEEGFMAHGRISLIDWAANAGYGVKCLYRYLDQEGWRDFLDGFGVKVVSASESMDLYPPLFNFLFGKKLQVLYAIEVSS